MGALDRQPNEPRAALPLGAFLVDDLGRISLTENKVGGFDFRWRGRPMSLQIDGGKGTASECRVRLSARVGRIPSTALSPDRRPDAFAVLTSLPALLSKGWRLSLLADHGLRLSTEVGLALPAMIGALLLPATRFALELAPYLDVLEGYGVAMDS